MGQTVKTEGPHIVRNKDDIDSKKTKTSNLVFKYYSIMLYSGTSNISIVSYLLWYLLYQPRIDFVKGIIFHFLFFIADYFYKLYQFYPEKISIQSIYAVYNIHNTNKRYFIIDQQIAFILCTTVSVFQSPLPFHASHNPFLNLRISAYRDKGLGF